METKASNTLLNMFGPGRGSRAGSEHVAARVHRRLLDVCCKGAQEALDDFHTSIQGLTTPEAAERLEQYGPNTVAREKKKHWAVQLLVRLRNPLNLLLIILSVMSLVTGDTTGAGIIALMVVVAVALAWIQEARSSRAAEKLHAMVKTTATVLRQEEIEDTTAP
ncbi:MAG: hypothetical protein KGL98_01585, partial [Gammaproteobacteria bacterium]|nr:hypothetical protein [Gammaproteobacteria bacterium]